MILVLLHSTKNKVTDFLFQNHRKEKVGSKKERRLPEASAGPKNANTRNFPTTTKRWCAANPSRIKDRRHLFYPILASALQLRALLRHILRLLTNAYGKLFTCDYHYHHR